MISLRERKHFGATKKGMKKRQNGNFFERERNLFASLKRKKKHTKFELLND